MNVRTSVDPDTGCASITFPLDHMNKGASSVKYSIPIDLGEGQIVLDINFAGRLIGMEIIGINEVLTPETLGEILKGP